MKRKRVGLIVSIFSTAIAAIYFFVYLYRWELHRALVAGVLFVAGEIVVATTLVLRKLESFRVQSRASVDSHSSDVRAELLPSTRDQNQTAQRHFRWLGMDRMNVFIPVLLGANIIVSGIAWLVEQSARSAPVQGRSVERELASLALPAGGFVEASSSRGLAVDDRATRSKGVSRVLRPATFVALAALVVMFVQLALSGRSRPDADTTGLRSNVMISLDTRNGLDHDLAARSLFEACHPMIENQLLVDLRRLETGRYLIILEPALGEQARRRFLGCLDDGVLERVHADIQDHTITPVGG